MDHLLCSRVRWLIKKILLKRAQLKVIISSATLDVDLDKSYFSYGLLSTQSVEVFTVAGRTHPVELFYLEKPTRDYIRQAVETTI